MKKRISQKGREGLVYAVIGPTSSGKSAYAVELAKKINGEIISADSRQVYKNCNFGTGKIIKKERQKIPHHLIDLVSPKTIFSVADYQKRGLKILEDIFARGKTPIICGGTGLYLDSLILKSSFPEIPPNKILRQKLERYSAEELFAILEKKDSRRAKNIDRHNKRRLVRALEIVETLGQVPPRENLTIRYPTKIIYLNPKDEILKKRIAERLNERLKKGLIAETKKLKSFGLSYRRLSEIGLEYHAVALYLQHKISKNEMIEKILKDSWQYVRRQRVWFKKYFKNFKFTAGAEGIGPSTAVLETAVLPLN